MTASAKCSGAQVALPRPVARALRQIGQDISAARRMRRLSQEDLAERIGTSASTVRRMEGGHPGTALHTFLRALHILGRLDAIGDALALEKDALGMELARDQLPQRIRTWHAKNRQANQRTAMSGERDPPGNVDDLDGF